MAIPYSQQYFVEKDRNNLLEWMIFAIGVFGLILFGLIFHWLPIYTRSKRDENKLRHRWMFQFTKLWETLNGCVGIKFPFKKNKFYFQPSLFLLGAIYAAINGIFCVIQTADIDYEPRFYIVGKRIGKIAIGNLPILNIMILKNDLVSAVTGLQHDRIEVMHHWVGRLIWLMITIHISLTVTYWIGLDFQVMIYIPPQIFGMIAYATMFLLTWGSMKFIRKWSYDFFLLQHKILSIILLLFVFFHNMNGTKAAVLIAVHIVVADRIVTRVIGFVHKRTSPTKGLADFKILDDDTVEVVVPVKSLMNQNKWYAMILPKIGSWNVGQHVYLTVSKISRLQYHPFTIASMPSTGDIRLVIRKQNGFTKKLIKSVKKLELDEEQDEESVKLVTLLAGPYGGKHQPLITFDSLLFLSTSAGSSFTFPLALDLLETIRQRDLECDYLHRPKRAMVKIVWVIRHLENINWYKDILIRLTKYLESNRLSIDVYVTRSKPKILTYKDVIEESSNTGPSKEFSTENDKGISFEMSTFEVKEKLELNQKTSSKERIQDFEQTTDLTNSSNSNLTSIISDLSNIKVYYSRPTAASLISPRVNHLCEENMAGGLRSLAVVGCGPKLLSHQIKEECQRNRWKKNAPDIYCYTERF